MPAAENYDPTAAVDSGGLHGGVAPEARGSRFDGRVWYGAAKAHAASSHCLASLHALYCFPQL